MKNLCKFIGLYSADHIYFIAFSALNDPFDRQIPADRLSSVDFGTLPAWNELHLSQEELIEMRTRVSPFKVPNNRVMHRRRSRKTPFGMISAEERGVVMGYLANLISAGYEQHFPEEIFAFCQSVLGERTVYEMLKPKFPGKLDASDREDLRGWATRTLKESDLTRMAREVFLPELEKEISGITGRRNRELSFRLNEVGEVFKLTGEELAVLEFYYLIGANDVAEMHLATEPIDLTNYTVFRNIGHVVLGMDRKRFLTLLGGTTLFEAGIIDLEMSGISVEHTISEYLTGLGDRKLKNSFFTREGKTHLELRDFDLPANELRVLKALLKGGGSCNLLFYGSPGTGKTSLARCLAGTFGLDLYSVRVDEQGDDHDFRFRAIHATINTVKRRNGLILVDEADEILNAAAMPNIRNITNKSWINNFLDNHDRKIIWITNRSREMDPSTMRRFAFSLKFDRLTAKNRTNVFQYELKKQGLKGSIEHTVVCELAKQYEVDAGGIVNAVNVMKLQRKAKPETLRQMAETVLRNHQEATIGRRASERQRNFTSYSLKGLNTSHDLQKIVYVLKEFFEGKMGKEVPFVSILLHGMPGTGKTEFVHYLGHALGKDITVKRVSDIEDKYVGETEKNIAAAFREAQTNGSILFFDEADSFFYPRKDAVRSFEKKFTNELLAQLDNFQGIVLFSTNDIEGLDHAALRRFKFKVQFRRLTREGVMHFYDLMLDPLARTECMLPREQERLMNIRNLTPGDFSVVKDQFSFAVNKEPTHGDLISALEREAEHKQERRMIRGFGAEKG